MIRFIAKKLLYWHSIKSQRQNDTQEAQQPTPEVTVFRSLKRNVDYFNEAIGKSGDVITHEFSFGKNCEFSATLIYIDGLVNTDLITESIIKPLILNKNLCGDSAFGILKTIETITETMLCSGDVKPSKLMSDLINGCFCGDTVMFVDSVDEALIINSKGWEKRAVSEPQTEVVVRGPREGFTENLRTNTALLRRRIKNEQFRLDHMMVGKRTRTSICLAYLKDVASPKIVEDLKRRLSLLNVDSIIDSGYIEQYIEDNPFSIYATVASSEKPDVVTGKILEGRIAIIVDGSPFVLTVPMLYTENFQTSEDYYVRPLYASMTRLLRYIAYFLAIFTVPIFVAMTTFHPELIPTTLLFSIAAAREGTPFPAFFEALVLVFAFEILREAGLRLPRPVGQTISIVGALIMGDAAVSAGIVGTPMVIMVALSSVAGFVVPAQLNSLFIERFIMLVLASTLGGFGIVMGLLAIAIHLASLKSFGVPYLTAFVPTKAGQDTFVRAPLWFMTRRPTEIAYGDTKRRSKFIPPLGKSDSTEEDEWN